jgi:hypothetical protein
VAVPNRPDVYVGVAFNADPFDTGATPTWVDLTSRVYRISSAKRGRQYELDRNQAGSLSIDWHNADEAINPVNTGSPYYPNVLPYRQVLVRAMWPNGGTGNLLNALYNGTDGSFESYTSGAAAPSWLTAVGGVVPTVTTSTPQQGTKCVTYTVTNSATAQGTSWVVPCIPGRQYTVSGYVRQTGTSTQRISVTGIGVGSSTATSGAYVRLTMTFTATQPTHTVSLLTTSVAPSAGTVFIDALQHEPGGSASTFTTTGPMIRNVWTRGYIERWPLGWVDGGFRGISVTPAVGPLAILANAALHTEVRNSIMAKGPALYWPLSESQGATVYAETSGNNGPSLVTWVSPSGATTLPAPGTDNNITGDPSGTGVLFTQGSIIPTSASDMGAVLGSGPAFRTPAVAFPVGATGSSWESTAVAWAQPTFPFVASAAAGEIVRVTTFLPTQGAGQLQTANIRVLSDGSVSTAIVVGTTVTVAQSATNLVNDGKFHLFVATVSQVSGGNTTLTLYVDGASVATTTVSTATAGLITAPAKNVMVSGRNDGTATSTMLGGIINHVALYGRALTAGEIADLWTAGKGYAGELESARIGRYLSYGGYTGPTNIGTGASIMGAGTVQEGDALLDSCQRASDSAFGNFFEDANGLAYASRNARYLQTTASYTFGERVDLGEYPYEDDVTFDFDPTLVLNVADITRTGGIKAHAEDTTGVSQKRYGRQNFTRTIDIASDNETVDAGTWVVANRKDPHLRVAAVTFAGGRVGGLTAADGTLWPMLLNLEIGTRVTLKRRPKAANLGAGITMSSDYFVESIDHHDIDFKTGEWKTTLLLSPITVAQPWILENAAYGVLDSTTVLGF